MYTTTQLLFLLAALSGTIAPTPTYAQDPNEIAPVAAMNVLVSVPVAAERAELFR